MLLGTGENAMKVHLIDFGLAKKVEIDSLVLETAKFFGTPLFASINSHYKEELSYRDDLESLCYVIAFLLNGNLPWSLADHRDHLAVARTKSTTTNSELFGDQ